MSRCVCELGDRLCITNQVLTVILDQGEGSNDGWVLRLRRSLKIFKGSIQSVFLFLQLLKLSTDLGSLGGRRTYKEGLDLDLKRLELAFDGLALLPPQYGRILRQDLYGLVVGMAPMSKVLNLGSHLLFEESHRRVDFIFRLQVH